VANWTVQPRRDNEVLLRRVGKETTWAGRHHAFVLFGIAAIGITEPESVTVASVITVIELLGLLLVVGVNYQSFSAFPGHIDVLAPPISLQGWGLVLSGAMLAFYAFLGFEDMVVIADGSAGR